MDGDDSLREASSLLLVMSSSAPVGGLVHEVLQISLQEILVVKMRRPYGMDTACSKLVFINTLIDSVYTYIIFRHSFYISINS